MEAVPATSEVTARRTALKAYAAPLVAGDGTIVGDGLEAGRPATPSEIGWHRPPSDEELPIGLTRCETCGAAAGEYLALSGEGSGDMTPRIVQVHCRCENHNRCAWCEQGLDDWRLSAYFWDESKASVCYVAAYCGLGHRCS
jgi:hypothetical protein